MDSVLQAYQKNLPGLMTTSAASLPDYEQAILKMNQQVAPGYSQLQADTYNQLAPQMNATGQKIAASNAMAQAESDRNVLQGPGADLIKQAQATQQSIDPEYYKARQQTSDQLSNLLGSYNMSGLSGSERSEVERSNNRDNANSGTAGVPNQTQTVSNAMNYGGRLDQKRQSLGQALGIAGSVMPTMKSGIDALQVGTGRGSGVNTGDARFLGINSGLTSSGQGVAGNVLNMAGQMQQQSNQINSQRRDGLDRFNESIGAIPS